MSSTSKSNTTTSSNQSVTPTNPGWVTGPLQGLTGQIEALNKGGPYQYVAQQNDLQQEANQNGKATLTGTNPNYTGAAGLINGNSSVNAGDIAKFMDPYTNDVVNSSNALFDQNSGRQNAALEAQGAASGAFGGSRFGVAQSVLGGQQALGRASLDSGLLSTGYNNAVTSAFNNKQLGQSAGTALTNIGNSETASNIANTAELANLGAAKQQTQQATKTAPISLAQTIAQLLGQNQFGLFHGENASGTSNSTTNTSSTDPLAIMKAILSGVQGAGSAGSSLASLFAPG